MILRLVQHETGLKKKSATQMVLFFSLDPGFQVTKLNDNSE